MKNTTFSSIFIRLVLFALLWTVVSGADFDEPVMVAVIVLLATVCSLYVLPCRSWKLHPVGCLRFIPYFLRHSLAGGWDVAWRAYSPLMPLKPAVIQYQTTTSEAQKALFAWCISCCLEPPQSRLGTIILKCTCWTNQWMYVQTC